MRSLTGISRSALFAIVFESVNFTNPTDSSFYMLNCFVYLLYVLAIFEGLDSLPMEECMQELERLHPIFNSEMKLV